MKKMIAITMALVLLGAGASFGQEVKQKTGKISQADLYNDFFASYAMGSIFYFIDHQSATANSTPGTFILGYCRGLNQVVAVGFQVSYTSMERSGEIYDYGYPTSYTYPRKVTDNYWQGMANVRFRYLNKSTFCMYSGIGIGVTMDYYSKLENGVTTKGQQLLPAGQFTLLGFRVGRALSFFGEFGIGTNSIVNAGVSYKFGDNE